jgi:hypothetical protein
LRDPLAKQEPRRWRSKVRLQDAAALARMMRWFAGELRSMSRSRYFMTQQAKTTTDHDEIRRWVEARGGKPATVASTGDEDEAGILRIEFQEHKSGQSLTSISWDEFFEKFEESKLAFLYQDETKQGEVSRFFKFVNRD